MKIVRPGIALCRVAIFGGLTGAGVSLLSGCNWSPPTLAVEMRRSATSETVGMSAQADVALLAPADTEKAAVTSQPAEVETVASETSDDGPSRPQLMPKLTSVDVSKLVGRWRDSFFGTRTLTLNADGSATMVLDLDFAGRLLYGKRLEFDMNWSLENGVVTIDILEGRPAAASKSAIGTWGSRYEYLLDRVDADAIVMRSSDGSMNHALKRLSDDE